MAEPGPPPTDLRNRLQQRALPHPDDRRPLARVRRLVVRTVVDSLDDRVPGLAAEMAFYFVLSLPPLLLAILGSVGFVVGGLPEREIAELEAQIVDLARTFLTEETVGDVLEGPIHSLLREGRSDVLSLGIVLTLWSASRATNVLIRTVIIAYDLEDHRRAWQRRLLALVITVIGIALVVVVIPLLVIGPRLATDILTAVGLDPGLARFWFVVYWMAVVAITVAGLTWLYHVAPGWYTPWRRDLPGSVLALVVWISATAGLRFYASNIGLGTGDAFQSLAAPIVLLVWVYLTAIAVLLGAELNAEIERLWPSAEGPFEGNPGGPQQA